MTNSRSDMALVGVGAPIIGALIMWFPMSGTQMARNIFAQSPLTEGWTTFALVVLGWGSIGHGVAQFVGLLTCADLSEWNDDCNAAFVFLWFLLSGFALASLWVTCLVHDEFHVSFGMLIIAWLLFAILVTLIIIAFRVGRAQDSRLR